MFGVSTKEDYALLIMNYLVRNRGSTPKSPKSLAEIAKIQKLPIRYLSNIAAKLKKAGLIGSKEGTGGGYFLAKKPNDISINDILNAVSAAHISYKCQGCASAQFCPTKSVWIDFDRELSKFKNKTLAEISKGGGKNG